MNCCKGLAGTICAKMTGYKMATKFLKNLWTRRNTWIIWTKSELKVHFITMYQGLRLEWE